MSENPDRLLTVSEHALIHAAEARMSVPTGFDAYAQAEAIADQVRDRDDPPTPRAVLLTVIRRDLEPAFRKLLAAGFHVARWRPIAEYKGHNQVWCWHERDRWFRVGRTLPHHGSRWYYTGSSDPEPTHFMILPEPPKENGE